MKKIAILFFALLLSTCVLVSCTNEEEPQSSDTSSADTSSSSSSSSTSESSSSTESSSSRESTSSSESSSQTSGQDDKKTATVPLIDYIVDIDSILDLDVFNDSADYGKETTSGTYTNYTTVNVAQKASGGVTYSIEDGGIYLLTGTSVDGQIYIKAKNKDVVLVLDNLNLTFSGDTPTIYAEKCSSVTIYTAKNSVNTVKDSSANTKKGAIYVKSCNLTVGGEGTLNVVGNYKSGIFNTKTLTINGGTYNVSAEYHGIYGEEGLVINGGNYTLNTKKSGFKTGDFIDPATALEGEASVLGQMTLNHGKAVITSETNGISSYGTINVNGGFYQINAKDGIQTEDGDMTLNGGIISINATADGLVSNQDVIISGTSNLKMVTASDGINAVNCEIGTSGIVYAENSTTYQKDNNGDYIYYQKTYIKVNRDDFPTKQFYSTVGSTRTVKLTGNLTITNGKIGLKSCENAVNATSVSLSGGKVYIVTNETALNASQDVTVSGADTVLNILRCYKGIKGNTVTVQNGTTCVVSVSDSIKADTLSVTGGQTVLFDTVDATIYQMTGGTLISLATKNKPVLPTETTFKAVSATVADASLYVYGKYAKIDNIVLKLPKNYSEKLSVVLISQEITAGTHTIDVGTYEGGSISTMIATGGTFTSEANALITVQ